MSPDPEGARDDAETATSVSRQREELLASVSGDSIDLGNEFAQVRVTKILTRNGARLLLQCPRSAQWVALDPLELEALTWQSTATFSAMIGKPYASLFEEES